MTLLYVNRATTSVMFAEELADLKDAHHRQFDLIHVLSREPRDVELFSGRLDADRLRALLTRLVPVADLDHVWLCGPFGMLADAREVLAELGVPADKVHFELFYVHEPPPQLRHADRVVDGVTSEVTVTIDGRTTTTPMERARPSSTPPRRSGATCRSPARAGCAAPAGRRSTVGEVDMVRNYALEPDEVARDFVLTCQTFPISPDVTVDYDA